MKDIKGFKNAPTSKDSVLDSEQLVKRLKPLVGTSIKLTRKARTDGANVRKIVENVLKDRICNALDDSQYKIIPPKGKGVPRLLLELMDTYVVTSGDTYNLQVWNRSPNGNNTMVQYNTGETITAHDIRFVLVKVDMEKDIIESIVILTPQYIEDKWGKFGKPTIKQQLLISDAVRQEIVKSDAHIYQTTDTDKVLSLTQAKYTKPTVLSNDKPVKGSIIPIETISDLVAKELIGVTLSAQDTKTRGQLLEREVIKLLGYGDGSKLVGGYPDVPNQLLEVKVQDTQTIDLGQYSPQFVETIDDDLSLTTQDIRYLIALTNPKTRAIEGVILSSGEKLGDKFTYVSDKSYKCQRSIPMTFFEHYKGGCVANP